MAAAPGKVGQQADGGGAEVEIDALYAVPLSDFVAARKQLSTARKKRGDADGARRVAALAKPNVSAWATNQTVRRAPELVRRLLAVTDKLATTQRAVGRGGQQQGEFQAALGEQREVLSRLREVAGEVLAEQGRGDGSAVMDKVEKNLRWGPLSDDERAAFERGRLTGDIPPPGFGALLAGGAGEVAAVRSVPAAPPPGRAVSAHARHPPPPPGSGASDKERKEAARERARADAEQSQVRKARLTEVRAQLRQASTETTDARRAVARSAQLRAAAEGRVRAVEEQLAAAQSALAAAAAAHQTALDKLAARETAEGKLRDRLRIEGEAKTSREG